jgi:hypothetical protein
MMSEGRCVDCGFLAYRCKLGGQGRFREHSGYVEVEQAVRNDPHAEEQIVPGESNAWKRGEPCCTRAVADLPHEIATLVSVKGMQPNAAAREAFNRERNCTRWTKYVAGLDPRQHILEANARQLEEDRRAFSREMSKLEERQAKRVHEQNWYLAKLAIGVTLAIGLVQSLLAVASLVPDSPGCRWLSRVDGWPSRICSKPSPPAPTNSESLSGV